MFLTVYLRNIFKESDSSYCDFRDVISILLNYKDSCISIKDVGEISKRFNYVDVLNNLEKNGYISLVNGFVECNNLQSLENKAEEYFYSKYPDVITAF